MRGVVKPGGEAEVAGVCGERRQMVFRRLWVCVGSGVAKMGAGIWQTDGVEWLWRWCRRKKERRGGAAAKERRGRLELREAATLAAAPALHALQKT